MKTAVTLLAVAALAGAQMTSPAPAAPLCHCELGLHGSHHSESALYALADRNASSCDIHGENQCRESCQTDVKAMDQAGGWELVPEGEDLSIGDAACLTLGRNETAGLQSHLFHAVCDDPWAEGGQAFTELLCCADGMYYACDMEQLYFV